MVNPLYSAWIVVGTSPLAPTREIVWAAQPEAGTVKRTATRVGCAGRSVDRNSSVPSGPRHRIDQPSEPPKSPSRDPTTA